MALVAELRRVLGPFDATALVVGTIVGVGIFFVPSRVAAVAGSGELALWTWVVGGAIAIAGALTFAELGGMYPRTGGQYDILRDAYGPALAFVYVVCNATAIQAGAIAIIAIVCVQNAALAASGASPSAGLVTALAAALIVALALANAAGVRWGSRIQNVTAVAKVATLLAVTAVAVWFDAPARPDPGNAQAPTHWTLAIAAGLVPALFAFGGWQQTLWLGGEVKKPERNVPIAILVGVALVVVVYLLVNWAYLKLLGFEAVAGSQALAADAAAAAFGGPGRRAIAAAVAISAFGVLNANLLTGPRLILALAQDGRLSPVLARVHATAGTPIAAIALLTTAALILLVAAGEKGIDRLLTGVVAIDGVFFALTGLAAVVLARQKPRVDRPLKMPGYPAIPILFALAELAVVAGAFVDPSVRSAAIISAIWVPAAALLYIFTSRPRG